MSGELAGSKLERSGAIMVVINLCRYDEAGTLSLAPCDIDKADFIAVSHVWGDASWVDIKGVPSKVLVSPQKAVWVEKSLPKIVGTAFFWMDVLAIDQSNKEQRVGIVRAIPDIYRKAKKTIVVREDGGFRPCCSDVLKDVHMDNTGLVNSADGDRLFEHGIRHHKSFSEKWLERLWPLQELLLSARVQFYLCSASDTVAESDARTSIIAVRDHWTKANDMVKVAGFWIRSGLKIWEADKKHSESDVEARIHAFLEAVLSAPCDGDAPIVEKLFPAHKEILSPAELLYDHQTSTRQTGRAQDYILAIFPSFDWYTVPSNVASMTFLDLYVDCWKQIQRLENTGLQPRYVRGLSAFGDLLSSSQSRAPSGRVPMPSSLQDFCRLFYVDMAAIGGENLEDETFQMHIHHPLDHLKLTADGFLEVLSRCLAATNRKILYRGLVALRDHAPRSVSSDGKNCVRKECVFQDENGAEVTYTIMLTPSEYIMLELGDIHSQLKYGNFLPPARLLNDPDVRIAMPRYWSLRSDWEPVRQAFTLNDSERLRNSCVQLLARLCCDVGNDRWIQQNLTPYFLSREGSLLEPIVSWDAEIDIAIMLGMPNLPFGEELPLCRWGGNEGRPFVLAYPGDNVIGLAHERELPLYKHAYTARLVCGCPYVFMKGKAGRNGEWKQFLNWLVWEARRAEYPDFVRRIPSDGIQSSLNFLLRPHGHQQSEFQMRFNSRAVQSSSD